MAKYGRKAQQKVKRALHEMKRGELESGKSGKKVTSRKQAIAIGLSEAREQGAKVPTAPKKTAQRTVKKATPKRKTVAKRTVKRAVKRTTAKRTIKAKSRR